MKLRNKKTGEIVDAWSFYDGNESINLKYFTDDGQINLEYRFLAELNEEWEDYKPKEPLIKDPKIRKAVKAWADALGVNEVYFYGAKTWIGLSQLAKGSDFSSRFELDYPDAKNTLENRDYSIAELCGEEEE